MPNSSWVAPKDRGKVIPGGTAENPLKARWLGIYAGAGIHGTDDVGLDRLSRVARLHPHADPGREELYDQVPVDAPVYICAKPSCA